MRPTSSCASHKVEPALHAVRHSALALLLSAPALAFSATTDISGQPLATLPTVQAKPNLLFILDNSGSMASAYMPDEMSGTGRYGYWASQCNGVAFDPTLTYDPPVNADGTSFPNASFLLAWDDGFAQSGPISLSGAFYYTYNNGSQVPMSWTYIKSNGDVDTTTTFYKECRSNIGSTPGSSVFTRVDVVAGTAIAQKYANWYSYYRTRRLLMRTATGKALQALGDGYRVGFTTISSTSVTSNAGFQDVMDFDTTQKATFYSKFYAATGSSTTPLRGALSKAGRYFAKKMSGQTYDPMQYSCQRNYALLSTDGYWNTGNESTSYGPNQLDGSTAVGQQDGAENRPMRDGTYSESTSITPTTNTEIQNVVTVTTIPRIWTRYVWTVPSATNTSSSCASGRYAVTRRASTRSESLDTTNTVVNQVTTVLTRTVIQRDGILISDTTSTGATTTSQLSNTNATTSDIYGAWSTSGTSTLVCATSANLTSYGLTAGTIAYSSTTSNTSAKTTNSDFAGSITTTSTLGVVGPTTTTQSASSVVGTTTTTTNSLTGVNNTLADVAQYYYNTDLRSTALGNCTSSASGSNQDLCANNLKSTGRDAATWQHMTTFTIGLGVNGTLAYDRNYLTQTTGDYVNLTNGTVAWPTPEVSSSGGDARNIDDLWHAAVNGRGQYYSALNAAALADAISGVVNTIQEVQGSSAAASTSALELVAGDNNQVYRASYTTKSWTGDLQAFTLNGTDASIGSTPVWSAQTQLDAKAASTRSILYRQPNTTTLRAFNYTNLNTDGFGGNFNNLCTQTVVASQCATMTTSERTLANGGARLVDYLRGVRTYESASAADGTTVPLYRKRTHVLGDIINGAPVYVAKPPFSYSDDGYASFVTTHTSRKPVVYVAANDGMLHAFSAAVADGGAELWAYVPTAVIPNLYKMADASYESKHQYSVDGAPMMADIKVGSTWKTILVGGLNSGGKSYYALDITDPANPIALWEFTHANLGLSYGNPIVAKRADGTWVVAFSSGYNNTTGDGKGHLFVVNANTGVLALDIPTTAGSPTDPSGLSKINGWIETTTDNTVARIYGGDLQGNLWRFDIDNAVEPHQAAMQLAKFQLDASTPQPITTKPETVAVSGKPVVVVATGRYLGSTDIEDSTQQTIYAVKDPMTSTGWGDVRSDTVNMVRQTLTASGTSATISNNPVDFASKGGWWVDLPHSRERVSTSMGLQFNTLAIVSAIPSGDACASGGSSWRYYLNVTNGGIITTENAGVQWSSDALVVGLGWVKLSNGNFRVVIQDSNGNIRTDTPPTTSTTGAGSAHRTSWRELTD